MSSGSELRRFLFQFWFWRLRIAIFFIGAALLAGAYLFLIAEQKYRLSLTFEPGKVPELLIDKLIDTEKGQRLLDSPKSIMERIQISSYDSKIRKSVGLNQDPKLNWTVNQPRDTDLVMVSINWNNNAGEITEHPFRQRST